MKKLTKFFIFHFSLLIALTACNPPIEQITLNKTMLVMQTNEEYRLVADAECEWESADPTIASVETQAPNETISPRPGLVHAHHAGQTIITATSKSGAKATCIVIVENPTLPQIALPKSPKRGVGYSFNIVGDVDLLAPYISWSYNWGNAPTSTDVEQKFQQYGLDFCPMCWNRNYNADRIRQFVAAHPQTQYLLGVNEPNLKDQCNDTPAEVASYWNDIVVLAKSLNLKLVSPAMNYGTVEGYGDPIVWLDEFFTLVNPDDIDAIAVHCYMGSAAAMKSYIDRFRKYNKPIWLTEFCAWEKSIGSVEAQMNYMCEAINYLEADPQIERYAWFIPRTNGAVESYPYMQLLTKTTPYELSPLGQVFAALPSQGGEYLIFAHKQLPIPATAYSRCNAYDATTNTFTQSVHINPCNDYSGGLCLVDFVAGKWVEYQLSTENLKLKTKNDLQLRYCSYSPAEIALTLNGETHTYTLPKTGNFDTWETTDLNIDNLLPSNPRPEILTLRIEILSGNIHINWLNINSIDLLD